MRPRKSKILIKIFFLVLAAGALVFGGQIPKWGGTHLPLPSPRIEAPSSQPAGWRVYFSPNGDCTDAITRAIEGAKTSVFVQAYSFTSNAIAKALAEAHGRGVSVEIILDEKALEDKGAEAVYLFKSGVPLRVDGAHRIAHNKVMIIDEETVITGSFNFTFAAEKQNAENLLVIQDKVLADQYVRNWREHQAHSDEYRRF